MGILRADRITGLGGADAIKGSVKFGNNHALEIHPNSADYRLGSNDFTIEFWGNTIGTGNAIMVGLFENNPARRSYTLETRSNRALRFECWSDGSSALKTLTSNTGVWELSTWHYFTVVRNGTALNIYVDGTSIASTTFDNASDSLYENTVDPLVLGASKQSNVYYATHGTLYISNFRLTNGTALYTGNFTPPNRELTKLSTTNVLCCQSSANPLKEETGKTIVAATNDTNSAPPQASHFTPNSPVGFSTTTDVGSQYGATFDGFTVFATSTYMVPPAGNSRERNRGRGLLMGGAVSPGSTNTTQIKYFDITSQGITEDFGQTTVARRSTGSLSSSTRGLMGGGFVAPTSPAHTVSDVLDFVTIASTANAIDFGNMQSTGYSYGTASNETRGLFAGGYRPNNSAIVDTIDLITIATTGNASDFGNLVVTRRSFGGLASPTRGIFMGGAPSTKDEIDYVTIATTGNAADFGNLTDGRDFVHGSSSSTRGVMGGGRTPSNTNIIDYITIASEGNATDFGDLLSATHYYAATGNSTRAVWVGDPSITNTMEYVTIATTGNSVDWGDQNGTTQHSGGACSDSHGGL